MIRANGYNISIAKGDRAVIRFHFTQSAPVDGTSIILNVAKLYDQSTAVITQSGTIDEGYVDISIPGSGSNSSNIDPGTYLYWLRADYSSGSPAGYDTPICGGRFEVLGAV